MIREHNASVLLLEDEALIAIEMEGCLLEAGFSIAGSFSSCSSALEWLRDGQPDIALLDIKLRDGICAEVARALLASGIPFVVYSGMSFDPEVHDVVFADARWVLKPLGPAAVIKSLAAAIGDRRVVASGSTASPSERGNIDHSTGDDQVKVPKKRVQLTMAQKRVQMEEATRIAFEDTERRRLHNAQKTARLRALRLSLGAHVQAL